jgi:hypothetical protein
VVIPLWLWGVVEQTASASTPRAWVRSQKAAPPRDICIASSTSQEEEHVNDPRKLWGLSDTCPWEKETSSLFQQDVSRNTQPYTRSAYRE